ncbi:hypothetical protein BDC45DRAFT_245581 [Circinella umbellata]|nr:hypothetical protein BDC45DRAFT_245581 [Circinella umbellata]
MSNCGVCPASQCVSRSVLGGGNSPPSASNTPTSSSGEENDSNSGNSNGNGSLIGGLVGGLLGAGLVLSAAGYAGFRYKQKKNTLPFAFHGKSTMSQQQSPSHSPTPPLSKTRSLTLPSHVSSSSPPMETISTSTNIPSMPMNNNSYSGEYDESSRQQVMSGVIPIAYIPPSRQSTSPNQLQQQNINHRPADTIQEQQQQYDNAVAQSYSVYSNKRTSHLTKQNSLQRHQSVLSTATDPFSDDHHSRNSMLTTDDEDDGRASISSSVVGHATTMSAIKATQAYQMQRAKPQIMRVNTVRVNNGDRNLIIMIKNYKKNKEKNSIKLFN